jgi:tuberous sclerosis protein 1
MLNTVRMHPLLVTHSRDQEKTSTRWRKMELHDVIVESSRYSGETQT